MPDVLESIKDRRSVRKYKTSDITDEDLNEILEAVRWSPSWANTQCWEIVVVRDPSIKKELKGCFKSKGNPARDAVEQAPVVIALCSKLKTSGYYKGEVATKFGDWFMFDTGIAAQNLCLAAYAKGLGSVIIGLFDHDMAARVLNVKEGYELVTMIPIGYPEKRPSAPKRKEIKDFVHYDSFQPKPA